MSKASRLLLTALALGLAAGGALAVASAGPAAAATLDQLSDRTHKTNMVALLGYHPKLVFFGGSRAMRFEPSYARLKWGLRGFNAAVQGYKHEDAWALAHHLVRRAPNQRKYVFWAIPSGGFFTTARFDVGLVKDRRLKRYFPSTLLATMDGGVSHPWANRSYAADGAVVYDRYDRLRAEGLTLDEALDAYIKRSLAHRNHSDTIPATVARARRYFEKTLGYLNAHDCEPLLVIMPLHPAVIAAIRDDHWDNWHASFLAYFAELQKTYRFTLLDFQHIESFGGDPDGFYDGDHMTRANMRRLLRAAVRQAPWAFGLAPSLSATPTPEPTPASSESPGPSASPTSSGSSTSPSTPAPAASVSSGLGAGSIVGLVAVAITALALLVVRLRHRSPGRT